MVWGQIHSRPELCLGISPLFLMFPHVFPWSDGWEADESRFSPVLLYVLCHVSATLAAHEIPAAALSKCPNHSPLSGVLTHFLEMWAALSPAGHCSIRWHTMAMLMTHVSLPRDNTLAKLWCLCGGGMVQGQVPSSHLGSQLQFLTRCAKGEKAGSVQGGWGGRTGASDTLSSTYTIQTAFLGGAGWYFGQVLVPGGKYK